MSELSTFYITDNKLPRS